MPEASKMRASSTSPHVPRALRERRAPSSEAVVRARSASRCAASRSCSARAQCWRARVCSIWSTRAVICSSCARTGASACNTDASPAERASADSTRRDSSSARACYRAASARNAPTSSPGCEARRATAPTYPSRAPTTSPTRRKTSDIPIAPRYEGPRTSASRGRSAGVQQPTRATVNRLSWV